MATDKIALIDLDGTVADHDSALLRDLQKIASSDDPKINLINLHSDHPEWVKNRMDMIRKQPGWWRALDPIKAGFDIYRLMLDVGFEPYILTKGPFSKPQAWSEKVEWVQHYMPEAHPILVSHTNTHLKNCTTPVTKGLIYGRVFFDDYPQFMDQWLAHRKNGLGIMLKSRCNEGYQHPNVIIYDGTNLSKIKEALEKAYNRSPGESLKL
jgi:5'-nucleotidase